MELKRIEYLRDVNTNSYLPQVVGDAKEIKDINASQDIELENLWALANKHHYNRWILTADGEGLKKYEELLGLNLKGTLEQRRKRIHFEWNKNIIYTDRSFRQIMDNLVGSENYKLDVTHGEYIVKFALIVKRGMTDNNLVYRELREIIPANMEIEFTLVAVSNVTFNTSFSHLKIPYHICGNHYTGTIYHHVVKGVSLEGEIVLGNKLDTRSFRLREAQKASEVGRVELYASENRSYLNDLWVFDNNKGARLNFAPIVRGGSPFNG